MKIDRYAVYNKYDGHCAYCGREIEITEMQVDHLIPQRLYEDPRNDLEYEMNDIRNLMPSCRRCNHYKRGNSLETYRALLLDMEHKVLGTYLGKIACDYKMLEWHGWNGKFYFESIPIKELTQS